MQQGIPGGKPGQNLTKNFKILKGLSQINEMAFFYILMLYNFGLSLKIFNNLNILNKNTIDQKKLSSRLI